MRKSLIAAAERKIRAIRSDDLEMLRQYAGYVACTCYKPRKNMGCNGEAEYCARAHYTQTLNRVIRSLR